VNPGARVRLRPKAGRDVWDTMLAGRTAVVERLETDMEGNPYVSVMLDDDPARQKFFFAPEELEPLARKRVLVAGIGNLFLGDDGFGCAVAARLADLPLPDGVEVHDFGVRGLDLAYALAGYDAAVLVDALPLGEPPGTLAVIEPQLDADDEAEIETHGMDPARVLRLARELGDVPERVLVVGCEPGSLEEFDGLSDLVCASVEQAAGLVGDLVQELLKGGGE
jgi:hydrogenase maturation protease